MINADLLMLYLSHLGEGSWAAVKSHFRVAGGAEAEAGGCALRYALEEMGFADFFVDREAPHGPQPGHGWRVLPTSLRMLASGQTALLCGARDPDVLQSLQEAAQAEDCTFEMRVVPAESPSGPCFTLPRVTGGAGGLAGVARRLDVPLVASAPDAWLERVSPLAETLRLAPKLELGLHRPGWEMRLCRPERRTWEPISCPPDAAVLAGSVLEWSRPWLPRQRAVLTTQRGWVGAGDREAVYLGALISHRPLLCYDVSTERLHVPAAFPLPRPCARAAAMCAGAPPRWQDGERVYAAVPAWLAAVIGFLLGQPGLDGIRGSRGTP